MPTHADGQAGGGGGGAKAKPTPKLVELAAVQKRVLLLEHDKGTPLSVLAEKFNISRRTASRINKERAKWMSVDAGTGKRDKQVLRPLLNRLVLDWLKRVRSQEVNLSVGRVAIAAAAVKIAGKLLANPPSTLSDKEKQSLNGFKPGVDWAKRFVREHKLQSVVLHGTAGEVNLEDPDILAKMEEIKAKADQYELECTYNTDEYGLFYKCLPRRTYLAPTESRKSARGTKKTKMKDRSTCWRSKESDGVEE